MTWKGIIASVMRCEIKARYDCFGGWAISANGALAVVAIMLFAMALLQRS